jgi:hypothetical protein
MMIMSLGLDYVSELRQPMGLLFIPRWSMSVENRGGMISIGENAWFVQQSSLVILAAQSSSSKSGGIWRRKWWIWPSKYLCSYFEVIFFSYQKILWHGADGFTSPKEGVLWIFIALKNQSPRPGLNPLTRVSMESTLNITPPRRPYGFILVL